MTTYGKVASGEERKGREEKRREEKRRRAAALQKGEEPAGSRRYEDGDVPFVAPLRMKSRCYKGPEKRAQRAACGLAKGVISEELYRELLDQRAVGNPQIKLIKLGREVFHDAGCKTENRRRTGSLGFRSRVVRGRVP